MANNKHVHQSEASPPQARTDEGRSLQLPTCDFLSVDTNLARTCPDLVRAPIVLSVGDLHIENFGTWRDGEGRLIWGINDFDEAYPLPYTNDLIRLAASAMLANSEHQLALKPKDACEVILSGYMSPRRFWKKLMDQDKVRGEVPKNISKMFKEVMPKTEVPYQFLWRVSGLGSLGRFRVVAVTESHGGKFAREVKALAPSACLWARNRESKRILYQSILRRAVRSHDPFV